MDKEKIWKTVLGELEVILSKAHFTTWFKDTSILSCTDKIVVIAVPNSFAQEWLKNKYNKEIFTCLKKHMPDLEKVDYKIVTNAKMAKLFDETKKVNPAPIEKVEIKEKPSNGNLNQDYVFNNFIVGNSNRLAHAMSISIAKNPGGKKYNPLFIYGGVGLGKTHLMHAVGNEIIKNFPTKKVIYAPCEVFANEFVDAIQNRKIEAFKKRYRNADLLLIDDIQFLSGKEGTQEEFFHTFNSLYQTNKQIILTSDRLPQAIPELADRLSSRFAGGMVTDIKQPDFETRCAILQEKCKIKNLELSDKTIQYIAKNIYSNIRELEGALNKITTHCELYGEKPSEDNVTKILENFISTNKNKNLSPDKIFKVIADFFSIKLEDLIGKRRNKELVHPRQVSMYLMRNEMNYSFPQIGKALGGKDHTTIMYGVDKIQKDLQKNDQLQREIILIKEKLYI